MPNVKTQVRLPSEMLWLLKQAAQKSHRSMNGEIVDRLHRSLVPDIVSPELAKRVALVEVGDESNERNGGDEP